MTGLEWADPDPSFVLARPKLNAVLDRAVRHRLTLIVAPAGYGKTFLLNQWARSESAAPRTIVLVEAHHEPDGPRMGVRSIRGEPTMAVLVSEVVAARPSPSSLDIAREELRSYVAQCSTPCVVLIDSLDALPDSARTALLDLMLEHQDQSPQLTFVAAGRRPNPRFLGRLATMGHLHQVFARDLVLSRPEVEGLLALRDATARTPQRLDAVVESTLGWPAGVALAGHLIGLEEQTGQWLPLDDYVATTILDALCPGTARLLFAVAEVPWIDNELWHAMASAMPGELDSFDTVRSVVPMMAAGERAGERQAFRVPPVLGASLRRLRQMAVERTGGTGDEGIDPFAPIDVALAWYFERGLMAEATALAGGTGRWARLTGALVSPCRELAIRDDHTELIERLSPLPDGPLLANDDLAFWYVLSLLSVGDVSEGTRLCNRIQALWGETRDPLRRGRLGVLRALLAVWNGRREDALNHALATVQTLPADAYHERMRAAATAEVLSTHLGDRATARRMFEVARTAREHMPWDQRWWAVFVLPNQADRTALEGNLSLATTQFLHLLDSYGEAFPSQMTLIHMRLALIALELGMPEEALARIDRIGPVAPVGYWMQEVPLARAKILHALGRDDEAEQLLYAAIRDAERDLDEIDVRRGRTVLAQLWLDRGAIDLADTWAEVESLAMDVWPRSFGQTVPGTVLAHQHILHGRWDVAIAVLDALIAEGNRRGQHAPLVRVFALKALALALSGDIDGCHDAIATAIRLGEASDFQYSYRVGTLDTRLLLHSRERTTEVARSFKPSSGVGDANPLSKREREVLLYAKDGLTNTEIAQRLFISPATVKNHLSRIYRRLGVRSREEAVIAAKSRSLL